MKKLILFASLALLICGCSESFDDSALNSRIDSLEQRLSALETVMRAYENKLTITSVDKLDNGYTITFSDGSKATITNGKDGANGKDGQNGKDGKDGVDGKDGQNGKDGVDGKDGQNGKDGKDGADGDTLIEYITITETGVTFKLTDGREFSIPFTQESEFAINFDSTEIAILEGGQSTTVSYTITGATEATVVKTITQDGWKAKVNAASTNAGTITITAPDPIVESEILVLVNDGSYRTLMVTINCVKGEINIAQSSFSIDSEGGEQTIKLTTNVNFIVDIPASAQSWISLIKTRAMRDESLTFHIAANDGLARFATISLKDSQDNILQTIVINQSGEITEIYVGTKGDLEKELKNYDCTKIKSLKISGVLNDVDFLFIYRMMPNLRDLDISDVKITTLPVRAFYQSKNIENIILPNTLTAIGESMFYQSNLKSVFIPKSVETIEQSAFENSKLLTSIIFEPEAQLTVIGASAFSGCFHLADYLKHTIEIPRNIEIIDEYAFSHCIELDAIYFGQNSHLKTIGTRAFYNCESLSSIEIPANVEIIEREAFVKCSTLTNVSFEEGSKLNTIKGGSVYEIGGAFSGCPIHSIIIPASVEIIEGGAFHNCSRLNFVTFERNSQLRTIGGVCVYSFPTLYYLGAFSDCSALRTIEIPASVETIEAGAFKNCSQLTTVSFVGESKLRIIGGDSYSGGETSGAFSGCAITAIEIPASVETIKSGAFQKCNKLTTVTFGNGSQLRIIEGNSNINYSGAFAYLESLATVDMGNCNFIQEIGNRTFDGDTELRLVKIGTSTPPYCGTRSFNGISPASVLKVPNESVSAYKAANGWSDFASITGLDE